MKPVLNSDLRRALRRGVAACLALAVFAASGGAALVGEVCTHHGGSAEASPQQPVASHGDPVASHRPGAASHDHDAHGGQAAAHEANEQHPAGAHDDGACTCLGACQTAATSATPAGADVVRVPAPAEVVTATIAVEPVPGASQSSWVLPPSNGPPALT